MAKQKTKSRAKREAAAESRGMRAPDQLWALGEMPDLDAIDGDMKKFFDVCREDRDRAD